MFQGGGDDDDGGDEGDADGVDGQSRRPTPALNHSLLAASPPAAG